MKNIFLEGPIPPALISSGIAGHAAKTGIGAHSIFLGQVRADEVDGKKVAAIEYTAYQEMALKKMQEIREAIFEKYPLHCMHIHHSLGRVPAGSLCFFVFTSAAHRREAIAACEELVERIKKELPVWGRELFEDHTDQWKQQH
ncbi:molybdenum cofactor biosynthesis protein MoaE [Niabella terrae]